MYLHLTIEGVVTEPGGAYVTKRGLTAYALVIEWRRALRSRHVNVGTERLQFVVRFTGFKAQTVMGMSPALQRGMGVYVEGRLTTCPAQDLVDWHGGEALPPTLAICGENVWVVVPEHFNFYEHARGLDGEDLDEERHGPDLGPDELGVRKGPPCANSLQKDSL